MHGHLQLVASATTSWTGWRLPTSWFAHWQWTRAGRGRSGSREPGAQRVDHSRPAPSTGIVSVGGGAGRGVADRRVLYRGTEHRGSRLGAGGPPDGGIDGLGSAGGEDDLARRDPDELGHLLAGHFELVAYRRASSWSRPGSAAGRADQPVSEASAPGRGGVVLAWSR